MSEAWEKSVPKPSKSYGTRWIDHKSVPKLSKSYGTRWIDHKLKSMQIV